jgi:hypothetical protein
MAPEHEQGNQPSVSIRQGVLHLASRGPSKAKPGYKVPALVFIAPKAGVYAIEATVSARIWEGQPAPTTFAAVKLDQQGFGRLLGKAVFLDSGQSEEFGRKGVKLAKGDRVAFVTKVKNHDMAGTTMLKDLKVVRTGDLDKNDMPFGKPLATYRPPRDWHGTKKGETDGNAVAAVEGKDEGEWQLERLYPGDPRDPELYALLPWSGKRWEATDQAFGGQPCVDVVGTKITLGARGPWPGHPGDKIPVLTFSAAKAGVYQLRGAATARIWESPQKPVLLRILCTDVDGTLAVAGECTIANGRTAELDEVVVELPPQGRISIMAVPTGGNQGANIQLSGFAILRH